ncbi:ABC transporter ATP-binding protein [Candidatus Aerophobetes bacterium]|uniref:ABC transporter ATP-binding protein n=1 Tax=Aerophobetes bacterium TaxID=2030807 RepID=A0A523RZF1_UNCAE|nr:MAG: ABC transporter ATP-binding protein [Candidatus Aerophobetes bacterium]
MDLIIETFGLTRKFANLTAVEDLSIQVSKGEILGFLGPNGAGKTTTIRILSGIIAPTKGHAVVAGIRTDKVAESLHEVIGLLTESPGFYQRLNATENLLYFAGFYDIDVDTQVDKYLKLMGLWQRRGDKLGTFSKGMKQRLALARALLHNPKVLFLDEPTAGLDPESAQEVRKLIRRLKEEGRTIFLSTHNLEEAESLCDRIGLFRTRLIALDSPKNLRNRLFQRQVVVELSSIDKELVEAVRNLNFVQQVEIEKTQLIIELKDFDKNRPELVRRIVQKEGSIQSVSEKKHSLEEIYLTLIKEEKECGI